jgi:HD-GYP domain-containing protein (c-di-GMP phosphodiesterase class II)
VLLCQGEHYDGSGYPEGLAGEEIPLAARIFSLADGLAAMSSDRPHRKRLNPPEILRELEKGAGTQWDPTLVLLTLDILREHHFFPLDEALLSQTRLLVSKKIAHSSGHTQ